MFYPCPSCKEGSIQDWRPESRILLEEPCVVCGTPAQESSEVMTVRYNLGCLKCKKAHCLPCIQKNCFPPEVGAQT